MLKSSHDKRPVSVITEITPYPSERVKALLIVSRRCFYYNDSFYVSGVEFTVPVKNQQHIPLFSEDPKLFFSEKER